MLPKKPALTEPPRTVYYTDAPVMDDRPYVQQNDARLTPGTMLLATGIFNVEGDPASCVEGHYQQTNEKFGKSMLEIRRGDLVRFMNKTKLPNLCYGELIRSTSSALQTDELLRKPLAGCFDSRRCVYATGAEEEPIPKSECLAELRNCQDCLRRPGVITLTQKTRLLCSSLSTSP